MTYALFFALSLHLSSHGSCDKVFNTLFDASTSFANSGKYAEAASLREGAARVFQICVKQGSAPRYGLYPFDGVGAYLLAGMFWHLIGQNDLAKSDLDSAKRSLKEIKDARHYAAGSDYQLNLLKMNQLIKNDEAGNWGIWK